MSEIKTIIILVFTAGFFTWVIFGQIENNHLAKGIRNHWSGNFATVGIGMMAMSAMFLAMRIIDFLWSGV